MITKCNYFITRIDDVKIYLNVKRFQNHSRRMKLKIYNQKKNRLTLNLIQLKLYSDSDDDHCDGYIVRE